MGLAERERTAKPRTRGGTECDVKKALADLDQEDADALVRLLYKRRDLSSSEVSDLLHEEGVEISTPTIGRHRRNRCVGCRKG